MKLLLLGTGTSHGIPVIGCDCAVCKSSDPHDKRWRAAAFFTTDGGSQILIDVGPDFRMQALEHNIKKLDAVFLTHSHADHLHGLDDLRVFSCDMFKKPENPGALAQYNAPAIPIYTNASTINDLTYRFAYFFIPVKEGGGHAKVQLKEASKPFVIDDVCVTPIPMMHGHLETVGWLFTKNKKSIAYLTDCNFISDDSIELIHKKAGRIVHLVIDGLRIKEHSTHFNFLQALEVSAKIGGEHIWFTHLTHNSSHEETTAYMEEHRAEFPGLANIKTLLPAYDVLVIES